MDLLITIISIICLIELVICIIFYEMNEYKIKNKLRKLNKKVLFFNYFKYLMLPKYNIFGKIILIILFMPMIFMVTLVHILEIILNILIIVFKKLFLKIHSYLLIKK